MRKGEIIRYRVREDRGNSRTTKAEATERNRMVVFDSLRKPYEFLSYFILPLVSKTRFRYRAITRFPLFNSTSPSKVDGRRSPATGSFESFLILMAAGRIGSVGRHPIRFDDLLILTRWNNYYEHGLKLLATYHL